jgi:hypothetical protein
VRAVGAFATLSGLSNLGLSVLLVSSYGAVGAALGTLFTTVLVLPVLLPIACRAVNTSTAAFVREGIGIALLSSLPGVAAMTALRLILPAGAGRLALGLTVGLAICAAVGISQVGAGQMRAALRGIRRGPQPAHASAGQAPDEFNPLSQPDQA